MKIFGVPYRFFYREWLRKAHKARFTGGDPRMVEEKRKLINEFHETFAGWKENVRRARHKQNEEMDRDVEICRLPA